MISALRALLWEQIWKNRVVFPALALMLLLGALLASALHNAPPDLWWIRYARGIVVVAFLASVLLGFALFSLMESHHGWRMNSMTTRWFTLPVPTFLLVLVPFVAACVTLGLLIGVWTLVLNQIAAGFAATYFCLVVILGATMMQTFAWIIPRRPSQFWPVAGVVLFATLLLGIIDSPDWIARRTRMLPWLASGVPCLALIAVWAAHRNRCGDWPGEIPVDRLRLWRPERQRRVPAYSSKATALLRADSWGTTRSFAWSWATFAVLLIGSQCLSFLLRGSSRGGPTLTFSLLAYLALQLLPFCTVLWLAVCGLFAGCEPGSGFRTQLSSLRATLPAGTGTLAAQRLGSVVILWLMVWLPLLVIVPWYDTSLAGTDPTTAKRELLASLAFWMAIGANVAVGALPLILWGRFDGFPNLLLCGMASWTLPWLLNLSLRTPGTEDVRWGVVLGWGTLKIIVAGWALFHGLRTRSITWRFATGLIGGWLGFSLLLGLLSAGPSPVAERAISIALFVPLARPALSAIALAANRHR